MKNNHFVAKVEMILTIFVEKSLFPEEYFSRCALGWTISDRCLKLRFLTTSFKADFISTIFMYI